MNVVEQDARRRQRGSDDRMARPNPTPQELVEALHTHREGARARFWEWLREPVRRLLVEIAARHHLTHNPERLLRHTLHAAETWLCTRPAGDFAGMALNTFRSAVLMQVAKQVLQPYGAERYATPGTAATTHAPDPLPETPGYLSQTVFLPYEQVGGQWYGGDWYGGHRTDDGSLWVFLADITGHGYAAYLLASSLPYVWRACWARDSSIRAPSDVLATMHELFERCLPDGVYVEGTLLLLHTTGQVTIVPCGGSKLLVRRRGTEVIEFLRLRGSWLGLSAPEEGEQHAHTLAAGDEVMAATDGLFDQLAEYEGSMTGFTRLVELELAEGTLLDAVRRVLQEALKKHAQKDDITLILIQRR
jgi:serine phosphatase RsbU (regulator of sigma subunit)